MEDDGEEDEAGRMTDSPRRCPVVAGCCSIGGDVVAMTSPRIGRGVRTSLSLSADRRGRSGERLAMVWTVKTSDGAEERRGTGEEVGGILRPGSISSFLSACFCFSSIYNKVYIII